MLAATSVLQPPAGAAHAVHTDATRKRNVGCCPAAKARHTALPRLITPAAAAHTKQMHDSTARATVCASLHSTAACTLRAAVPRTEPCFVFYVAHSGHKRRSYVHITGIIRVIWQRVAGGRRCLGSLVCDPWRVIAVNHRVIAPARAPGRGAAAAHPARALIAGVRVSNLGRARAPCRTAKSGGLPPFQWRWTVHHVMCQLAASVGLTVLALTRLHAR